MNFSFGQIRTSQNPRGNTAVPSKILAHEQLSKCKFVQIEILIKQLARRFRGLKKA